MTGVVELGGGAEKVSMLIVIDPEANSCPLSQLQGQEAGWWPPPLHRPSLHHEGSMRNGSWGRYGPVK